MVDEVNDFSEWLQRLDSGDEAAAAEVFHRFVYRLIGLARAQIEKVIPPKEDPEDVVQSVFRSFFRRQRDGQFTLDNWDSLWSLLAVITLRKCGNRIDYFHAGCRNVQKETCVAAKDSEPVAMQPVDREPTPEEAVLLTDTLELLLRRLNESDREILSLHLQGFTVPEIAQEVDYSQRTVWRGLTRIRKKANQLFSANREDDALQDRPAVGS